MAKKTTYKKWTTEYRKRHTAEYNKENYDSLLMKIPKSRFARRLVGVVYL